MDAIATLTSSVVGNFTIEPAMLRGMLKKSCYFLDYDRNKRKIVFWFNDGGGGKVIFEIEHSSYENAKKIAEGLGLAETQNCHWSVWNPKLALYHDGSDNAEMLRLEMLRLGVPHSTIKSDTLALGDSPVRYTAPAWTAEQMLAIIRDVAQRYEKQLAATP